MKIVIIEKTGKVKTQSVKSLTLDELYKKCKFPKSKDFGKRHTWKYQNHFVSVYSKGSGRAGHENKYELPPPIDSKLYFGNMAIVQHEKKEPCDESVMETTKEEWEKIYNHLMGGFDDLDEEEEEEEIEEIPTEFLSKQGYSKESGFIVEDSDSLSSEKEDESEGEFITETETETDTELSDKEDGEENEEALFGKESDCEDNEEDDEDIVSEVSSEEEDAGEDSELSQEEYKY